MVFSESHNILMDILSMCSLMYQKGIVDSNNLCDNMAVRRLANRAEEEHYTTLQVIIDDKIRILTEKQFLNIARVLASENKCFAYRNFTLNGKPTLISATCILFDYCYRLGAAKTVIFDRSKISSMIKGRNVNANQYFTPKGRIKTKEWFDTIRSYITIIELDSERNARKMAALDEYFATTMRNINEIEQIESIANERRKFILSGGTV